MNDRIKELLQKSMVEHQFDIRLDPERLIALTVQECISKLEEEIVWSIDRRGDEVRPDVILKKHFGVEL